MKEFRKTNFGLSSYITSQNKCTKRNFALSKYSDITGRKLKCYELTRDGFTALVMRFTGGKANQFKEWYINRFNEMEEL